MESHVGFIDNSGQYGLVPHELLPFTSTDYKQGYRSPSHLHTLFKV